MEHRKGWLKDPQGIGVACAVVATSLGLAYMAVAGAPMIYLAVNAGALVLGLAVFALMQSAGQIPSLSGGAILFPGGLLLATALFGVSVDGATRWVRVGPLSLQVSLIFLPAMVVAFAQRRDLLATLGVALAAVALALQPDRAMAGVLASALGVLALQRRDRWVVSALLIAVVSFAMTLLRPDRLPAVPYVDRILYSAFQVHTLAGIAVVGGAFLLVVPAIADQILGGGNRDVYSVFGVVWLSIVVAAALGNYPTPLVGYGGSAVLGYVLCLLFMPGKARAMAASAVRSESQFQGENDGTPDLCIRAAV
ncbi:FtsW/RodA/SpoVE family cell cycle protein [soil metagenome]